MLRTRSYVQLLVLAAVIGVPVSAVAYAFLKLVSVLQQWTFTTLPEEIGFQGAPAWWPLPLLALAGLLVSLTINYLPGRGATRRPMGSTRAVPQTRGTCPGCSSQHWPP